MRTTISFLVLFLSSTLPWAAEPAADKKVAEGVDDRLLQAELLEVSAGDLQKATEAYRALLGDEEAPARVRARALLCLGRCQRKLGELEAARKTLEELVTTYPDEREVVRQARSFLEELKTGKAENPEFDWISRLERSPEIQARVFELAMDLVDARSEGGQRAARQLLARVDALLRRSHGPAKTLSFGAVKIDFERRKVFLRKSEVELSRKELELLLYLARNRDRVLTREEIHSAVWGHFASSGDRAVDYHVLHLRRKLEEDPTEPRHIVTRHGLGYQLVV